MYDIGILGGMGPKATSLLFQLIVENTKADSDQEHMSIIIANKPQIPDRSAYLLGDSEVSPLPMLREGIAELEVAGAKYIIMPCNTTHHFYPALVQGTNAKIVNMVETALNYVHKSAPQKKVMVLGTLGTIQCGVYETFNIFGVPILYPAQQECNSIHNIIYDVKKAARSDETLAAELHALVRQIEERERNVVFILACTELSCLKHLMPEQDNVVDALELLAITSIYLAEKTPIQRTQYDYRLIEITAQEQGGVLLTNGR